MHSYDYDGRAGDSPDGDAAVGGGGGGAAAHVHGCVEGYDHVAVAVAAGDDDDGGDDDDHDG